MTPPPPKGPPLHLHGGAHGPHQKPRRRRRLRRQLRHGHRWPHPGPRSFHGLIVAHALNGDAEAAMQSLRREPSAGLRPIKKTFVALIRLFGSKGPATKGMEILAAMEKLNCDVRGAWLMLPIPNLVLY